MFFFTKNKKIVLDCFTSDSEVYRQAPITTANKHIPDWWKNLPDMSEKDFFDLRNNMKFCSGLIDHYKKGFMLPLWSDFAVEVGGNDPQNDSYRYQFADNRSSAHSHHPEEWGDFLDPKDVMHIKLISPWVLRCNKNVEFLFMEPTWSFGKDMSGISVPPGVLNYYWQSSSNIQLLFAREKNNHTYMLKLGTPLAHIIPLTDKKVSLQLHLVTEQELEHKRKRTLTFSNKSNQLKKSCPFAKKTGS